jgi:hypothetical protein
MVDKLFDELKELSRRVDERRQAPQPLPPVIVNMRQPGDRRGGPRPMSPIVMDLPSAQPPMEGFPRYAAADSGGEDEDHAPTRQRDEVELKEVPEILEPDDMETEVQELPSPQEPALGPLSESQPEIGPTPAPPTPRKSAKPSRRPRLFGKKAPQPPPARQAPRTVPPATAAPDIEEAFLEPVPETESAAPRPRERTQETSRTGEDVRNELRDYLDGVRDKLARGGAPSGPGDLLDYLGKLSDYLPENEKKRFRGSNERLAMESLKAQLAGKKGLLNKVVESVRPVVPRRKEPMTPSLVVDTFSYLKDLTAWHPDKAVASAMKERIESIVAQLGRSR